MKIAVYYNYTGQPDKLNLLVIIPTSFDNQIISGYPEARGFPVPRHPVLASRTTNQYKS